MDELLEKTMASGEVMTLARDSLGRGWDVDQWDTDGNCRWNRWYDSYDKAKAEYDRWN